MTHGMLGRPFFEFERVSTHMHVLFPSRPFSLLPPCTSPTLSESGIYSTEKSFLFTIWKWIPKQLGPPFFLVLFSPGVFSSVSDPETPLHNLRLQKKRFLSTILSRQRWPPPLMFRNDWVSLCLFFQPVDKPLLFCHDHMSSSTPEFDYTPKEMSPRLSALNPITTFLSSPSSFSTSLFFFFPFFFHVSSSEHVLFLPLTLNVDCPLWPLQFSLGTQDLWKFA